MSRYALPLVVVLFALAPSAAWASDSSSSVLVSAGGSHSCGVDSGGLVSCWGDDSAGQLDGIPDGGLRAVSAGGAHTCAIRADAALVCWGDDSAGQLDGIPDGGFRSVSAGGTHTCAIRTNGRLACWGDDSSGQLDWIPWGEFISVSAGGTRTCAIRSDGHLSCWGGHRHHHFWHHHHGHNPWATFLSVSVGGAHTCAIRADAELACWGDDSAGQLDGIPDGQFLSVSAGGTHTCAIRTDRELACWGDDSAGQLDGIPDGQFLSVSAGGSHTCAVRSDGQVLCWGDNHYGQSRPELIDLELPPAVIGTHYSHQIGTTPQAPGSDFFVSSGQLPDGISLSDSGELFGSPTVAGSYVFTVTAANGIAEDVARELTLDVVGAPSLSAGPAAAVTTSGANLIGTIDPRNLDTEAWFEYWPASASPQDATRTEIQSVAAGSSPVGLSAPVEGLSPDTDYFFRLAATNELGPDPVYSETASMRTAAPPAAKVVTAPVVSGPPPPVAGESVNIDNAGGSVKTKCPGDSGFTGVVTAEQVPVGCLIDTTRGTVSLTASKGGVEYQSAYFWGGVFRVTQNAGQDQDAVMTLAGKLRCEARASGSRSGKRSRRGGGGRKLWGSGEGNYKTVGNHGAATVRGTIWLVQDRCDGSTLFKVKSGIVSIKDFVKGIRVLLHPGEQYVIEPPTPRLGL